MTNPVCPQTGAPMYRGVRPMTLTYKGESLTFDMPGWYCDQSEESIHTGEDMKISDRKLNLLNPTTQLTFVYPVQLTFFVGVTNMNGDSWLVSSRQVPASFQYRTFSSAA